MFMARYFNQVYYCSLIPDSVVLSLHLSHSLQYFLLQMNSVITAVILL